jgi:hypothetical protein
LDLNASADKITVLTQQTSHEVSVRVDRDSFPLTLAQSAYHYIPAMDTQHTILLSRTGDGFIHAGTSQWIPFHAMGAPVDAAICQNRLYWYGKDSCLHSQDGFVEDLSAYDLSVPRLYATRDHLILTGVAQDQAATLTREPIVALFFTCVGDEGLIFVGDRRFPIIMETFDAVCADPNDRRFYLFFPKSTLDYQPETPGQPFVLHGELNQILSGTEQGTYLHCQRTDISVVAGDRHLWVCSDGMLTVHDAQTLTYLTALGEDPPIRMIRPYAPTGHITAVAGTRVSRICLRSQQEERK